MYLGLTYSFLSSDSIDPNVINGYQWDTVHHFVIPYVEALAGKDLPLILTL